MAKDTMTAADWAICITYLLIAAGFFTALIHGERRQRAAEEIIAKAAAEVVAEAEQIAREARR